MDYQVVLISVVTPIVLSAIATYVSFRQFKATLRQNAHEKQQAHEQQAREQRMREQQAVRQAKLESEKQIEAVRTAVWEQYQELIDELRKELSYCREQLQNAKKQD